MVLTLAIVRPEDRKDRGVSVIRIAVRLFACEVVVNEMPRHTGLIQVRLVSVRAILHIQGKRLPGSVAAIDVASVERPVVRGARSSSRHGPCATRRRACSDPLTVASIGADRPTDGRSDSWSDGQR